mmetsp:Transcript_28558/g.40397  ORF Transcript_28558/g.40397 Transcript_28558/m.40397 type:complete len:92 (+) Transcript_28558:60-335(+)
MTGEQTSSQPASYSLRRDRRAFPFLYLEHRPGAMITSKYFFSRRMGIFLNLVSSLQLPDKVDTEEVADEPFCQTDSILFCCTVKRNRIAVV